MLQRFWFEFEPDDLIDKYPGQLNLGVGVTAYNLIDAKNLMRRQIFKGSYPRIVKIVPNISFDELERDHVQRGTGVMAVRGIWFPNGLRNLNYLD